jgi:hypothetical protein
MKTSDIISIKIGQTEADVANLQEDVEHQGDRIAALEKDKQLKDIAIAKCTAIWGFMLTVGGAIGGFIAYNFDKVKAAVVAAFHAFTSNGN